ncbi:hypothetical protein [Leifsonia sp. 1010]|uniref:hypothetical protein n=1 Tax=Leifsonia sp. 1010 TaxID=2817769 RepID=UPI00285BC63B|nr:hypothetical protein [Leifsonia sp. 1010]MDR6612495.1 DNA invertase Pin-like site-specific DNA recombinase [Leifsonia sp. 1010]
MSTISGAIAEFESHVKRERVKASLERRLALGQDLGGARPFGFTEDRKGIVEAEADLVRTAYRMVLDGESLYSSRRCSQRLAFQLRAVVSGVPPTSARCSAVVATQAF